MEDISTVTRHQHSPQSDVTAFPAISPNADRALMRTPEAADYLGMSESWLNKTRVTGNGPKYVKLSRAVAYRRSDLDSFLNQRVRNSTSEAA
jgi:predicted DNA-binding transcriptional regulator AlpA